MMKKSFYVRFSFVLFALFMFSVFQLSLLESASARDSNAHCTVQFKEAYYLSDGSLQAVFYFKNDGRKRITVTGIDFKNLRFNFREKTLNWKKVSFGLNDTIRPGYYVEKAFTFTRTGRRLRGNPTCNFGYNVRYKIHNR